MPVEPTTIALHVEGARPILVNNGRLANALDPYTRRLKQLTGKRNKTDEDLIQIMRVEARGGAYETEDNKLAMPAENVWKSLHEAATAFKRGRDIQRGLIFDSTQIVPLLIDGKEQDVDEYLSDLDHIDYRTASPTRGRKVMRARPLIVLPWSCTVTFDLLTDVLDTRDLEPIIERAGRLVGLGNYRPNYGAYAGKLEVL
jgi:hypothetical protein